MNQTTHRIFKWSRRSEWESVLASLLDNMIDTAVIEEVRRLNPRHLRDDKFGWLNASVAKVRNQPLDDIPTLIGLRLPNYYEFVTAFHGSRCLSPAAFLKCGLKPADTAALKVRAVEIFGPSDALYDAVSELQNRGYETHNAGRIWLCLAKEPFLHEHKHYLRHGSEYLAAIANRVGQIAKLETIGVPVVVECLIPTLNLTPEFWQSLSRDLIEDYFSRVLRPSEKRPVSTFCIAVTQTIPPEKIIRVHQFEEKRRTFRWRDISTGVLRPGEHITLHPNGGLDGIGRSNSR